MEHGDIEHMAQGYPPAHISKDSEEVIVWLATQLLATQEQRDALANENAALKDSVDHAAGCIHAAEVEGLEDALESNDGERLADLIHRRLCHAHLPVDTPATESYFNSVRAEGVNIFLEENPAALGNGVIASLREKFLPKIASGQLNDQLRSGNGG